MKCNDIVRFHLKNNALYVVEDIQPKFNEFTVQDFICLNHRVSGTEQTLELFTNNFLQKFKIQKSEKSQLLMTYLKGSKVSHNLINFISKEFIENFEQDKPVLCLSSIKGYQSFKVTGSKNQDETLKIKSINTVLRLCTKDQEGLKRVPLGEKDLIYWLKIPSVMQYFVFQSKILTFLHMYEVRPK